MCIVVLRVLLSFKAVKIFTKSERSAISFMKKLFALFMVVAMLSVAGTAMATSITADSTSVTLQRGNSTTVSVTGTASHGGTLAYSLVYSAGTTSEWASISGTTVTLTAPSTASAGFYTVIVRVTETYTDGSDSVGHGTPVPQTDTADVQITVNVTVPVTPNQGGGSSGANSETATIVVVTTETVAAVSVPRATSVVIVTVANIVRPSTNSTTITTNAGTYGSRLGGGTSTTVLDKSNSNAVEFSASNKTGQALVNEKAANLKKANKGNNARLGPTLPDIVAKVSGLLGFDLNYGANFYGAKPGFIANATGANVGGSFFASAGEDAIFLDSTGAETQVVPGGGYGNAGAEPGVVTAVVYVESGIRYEPVTYAEIPAEKLAAFDEATGTTEQSVELETITTITETVNSTSTFSPVVADERVRDAVTAAYGKTVSELPYTTASTTKTWSASTEETSYMTANNLVFVSSLPVLENIPDGTYIAAITFDNTPSRAVVGAPKFYPNGVSATGAATSAKIYTYANGSATEVTASNAKSVITNGRAAYLVFEVANSAVATADFEASAVTLNKPAIAVVNTASTPVSPDEPSGVGGSSGGCSTASAALALAVLGTFIATRKK